MIYLDYTANTPADPDVLDAYLAAERRYIANPNSTHIAVQQGRYCFYFTADADNNQ